jgi:hypothetical protein
MLIRGDRLNARQRQQVLAAYCMRLTPSTLSGREYAKRNGHYHCPTDEEWLRQHAFHFVKDGSRLMENRRHCEDASMADDPDDARAEYETTRVAELTGLTFEEWVENHG